MANTATALNCQSNQKLLRWGLFIGAACIAHATPSLKSDMGHFCVWVSSPPTLWISPWQVIVYRRPHSLALPMFTLDMRNSEQGSSLHVPVRNSEPSVHRTLQRSEHLVARGGPGQAGVQVAGERPRLSVNALHVELVARHLHLPVVHLVQPELVEELVGIRKNKRKGLGKHGTRPNFKIKIYECNKIQWQY